MCMVKSLFDYSNCLGVPMFWIFTILFTVINAITPEPLYNMVCFNMVLDTTRIRVGP